MPCSICKKVGHNYKTCPDLSSEQREKLIQENKKKKEDARKRKEERRKNEISWVKMEVSNLNEYDIVVYWGFNYGTGSVGSDDLRFISTIGSYGSTPPVRFIREKARVVAFPIFEVINSDGGVESVIQGDSISDKVKIFDVYLADYSEENIVIPKTEYTPPKTELEQWKEFGLKNNFILKEIEKLSTYVDKDGVRVAHEKYDTIGPLIEMIQDIKDPKCSDIDREFAGIPSRLTNIT
tara:strand:+ start:4075 stop:4785 length:711 start_codon:yes stop_codon:yes gene_type:complete